MRLGAESVHVTPIDVAEREALAQYAQRSLELLGGCDLLLHNAGGGGPGGVLSQDEESFERDFNYAFNLNVMAAARLARHAASALRESRGVVTLISSAWRRRPSSDMPASYGAAKAALDALTGSLAREFGPSGVRVFGVAPGPIWTETWEHDLQRQAERSGRAIEELRAETMKEVGSTTVLGRPGTMEEVAKTIAWLSGEGSSYLSGTTVLVDGGFVAGT